jgi:hypothetical protein
MARGPESSDGVGLYTVNLDLVTIPSIPIPVSSLERYVFERLSLQGRALAAAAELISAHELFNDMMDRRNKLSEEISSSGRDIQETLKLFYGEFSEGNLASSRYSSIMENIDTYANDCIFFSDVLCKDLLSYGAKIRRENSRFKLPKLPVVNWDYSRSAGLIPNASDYEGWLRGFPEKEGWFRRIKGMVYRKVRRGERRASVV